MASGYSRATASSTYTAAAGFGWLSGTVSARDRGAGTSLTRDLVFTPMATFAMDLPVGIYNVKLTVGDSSFAHDQMGVYLEGALADTLSTAAKQFLTKAYQVSVTDGQLTLLLDDLGGADPNVVLNGLEVTHAQVLPLDFGTSTSPLAPGYSRVTPSSTYSASSGHGWLSGTVGARDRTSGTSLTRDFNYSPLATFAIDLPSAFYELTLTVGDATRAHEQMSFSLENGAAATTLSTAAGSFTRSTLAGEVDDGQLTLDLADLGGADLNVVLNAIDLVPADLLKLDFGTTTSPLAAGYRRVEPGTTYRASRGYGWVSGTITARNRATGSSLTRDLNATTEGTFAVDCPNGSRQVTLTIGDMSYAHDQMDVSLEGTLQETLSTSAGQVLTRTYTVTVSDGQLTLLLDDQGGSDAYAVINGLEIR